jgi:foldase protein PrsA
MNVPAEDRPQSRLMRLRKPLTWLLVGLVIALTAAYAQGQAAPTAPANDATAPVWAGGQHATPTEQQPAPTPAESPPAAPAEARQPAEAPAQPIVPPPVTPSARDGHLTPDQVASVNGQPIERRLLVAKLLQYYGERALDSIIQQMVIVQEAERLGLAVTRTELDEALEDFYRTGAFPDTMPMSERRRTWTELLRNRGLTLDDFRQDLRVELLLRKLAERRVQVTEEMIRARHEQLFGERLIVSWIVVANEMEAREVSRRLASGADFETLARQVSSDVGSASLGGRLPQPILRGERSADFDAAVFALQPGQVSRPLRVTQGWAVVRLDQRIPADDVPLERVREQVRAAVAEEAQASMRPVILQELLRKARIVRGPLVPADQ